MRGPIRPITCLAVYLRRWEIERAFQKIVEVFELRRLIGSTPRATIFQAAFCLLLYNLLHVMRAFVAAGQEGLAAESVSMRSSSTTCRRS